jgi:hypothetical protein
VYDHSGVVLDCGRPTLPHRRYRNVMPASSELPPELLCSSSSATDQRRVGITYQKDAHGFPSIAKDIL